MQDDRPFELRGEHYVVAGMEERLSLSIQRPVYVPTEPALGLAPITRDEEGAATLDIAKKARVAPH
jgi:hypothetical protein